MAYIAVFASPLAMATTQLQRESVREVFAPIHLELNDTSHAPRLNWVVVIDNNGNRRLRMHWTAEAS